MDPNAEVADVKRQIAGLRKDVAAARAEAKAVAIAFSVMLDEVRTREPEVLAGFKTNLQRHISSQQTNGDLDLIRALSELYRKA